MKNRITNRAPKIGAILLALCVLGLALASVVPFRGSSTGTFAFTSASSATVDSSGHATILGPFQNHEELTFDESGGVSGTITWTTANGATMTAAVAGAFTSPTTVSGFYTVTGGTGRLSGAAGTGRFTASITGPGTLATTFSGELTSH